MTARSAEHVCNSLSDHSKCVRELKAMAWLHGDMSRWGYCKLPRKLSHERQLYAVYTVSLQLSLKKLALSRTLHAGSGRHTERAHLMRGSTAAGDT